jgi:ABC-type branched-chain amino acid transport systems, ATPase component
LVAEPLLRVERVSKSFDGVRALDGVSLAVRAGEVLGIIGPNGAGKSTLAGIVAGWIAPSSGRVLLGGKEITALPVRMRALLGIAATHQTPRVFTSLTVQENIELAAGKRGEDMIREVAEKLDLTSKLHQRASSLSFGHRRLLELAMALASSPRLLVLDEPSQGLSTEETGRLESVIMGLRDVGVLLIDHRVDFVSRISNSVAVMNSGRVIALGRPREEAVSAAIKRAYLREET